MRKKMTPKMGHKRVVTNKPSEKGTWPQFKKNYSDTFKKKFSQTNPGMVEILDVLDKGASAKGKKSSKSSSSKKNRKKIPKAA